VYNGTAWVQRGVDLDGSATGDEFGTSVDLSKNGLYLIGGAPKNDTGGSNAGHARVFFISQRLVVRGIQIGPNINGTVVNEQSGTSVSVSNTGTRVAVGTPTANRSRAYNYSQVSNVPAWDRLHRDMGGNGSGGSMSMSDEGLRLVVGLSNFQQQRGPNTGI
jgi:hypothetical protein